MKKLINSLLAILISSISLAQLQNANWCFGNQAKLNFNTTIPTPSSCSITATPGAGTGIASVSSNTGELLFYTNGNLVWGKDNSLMPNGNHLFGGSIMGANSQYTIIVPKPGAINLYYVFTACSGIPSSSLEGHDGIYYSVVDMDLNSGNGDIISGLKNIPLKNQAGIPIDYDSNTGLGLQAKNVKLTSTLNQAGNKIWATFMLRFDNAGVPERYLYSYLISSVGINDEMDGVSPQPTATSIIPTINYTITPMINQDQAGLIKISPDGSRLCDASVFDVNLYKFNNQTGLALFNSTIYNDLTFENVSGLGVEFSPNSQLVYFTTAPATIFQQGRPMNNTEPQTVKIFQNNIGNSYTEVIGEYAVDDEVEPNVVTPIPAQGPGGLQLAIDGKIYVCVGGFGSTRLGAIRQPNLTSLACDFVAFEVQLVTGTRHWGGLPQWVHKVTPEAWTWMNGDITTNAQSIYGIQGVSSPLNKPGARFGSASWTDLAGNLWLFGGDMIQAGAGYWLNDLWKYDINTNQWTWMKGSNSVNAPSIFGTIGVPNDNNTPGGKYDAQTWVDLSGNLWLYGGAMGVMIGNYHRDLWKYNITTNQWTWINGSNNPFSPTNYGVQGVASVSNDPGAKGATTTWVDNQGDFWMYGGYSSDALWKYSVSTNMWTWVKGDNSLIPNYGIKGVAAVSNKPGEKFYAVGWADNSNNLWLFGGQDLTSGTSAPNDQGYYNDLWKYNITTNQWTWVSGDNIPSQNGIYGIKGVASPTNKPGARRLAISWTDASNGNLWLFGGEGNVASIPNDTYGVLNDLWKYNITTDQWTWVSGDNTINMPAIYGSLGVTSSTSNPGSRAFLSAWREPSNGTLWLFGGLKMDGGTSYRRSNDLWKYNNPITGQCCQARNNITINNAKESPAKQQNKFEYQLVETSKSVLSEEKIVQYKQLAGIPIDFIHLYNANGQLLRVIAKKGETDNLLLNNKVSGLGTGLYFLRIKYKDKSAITLKRLLW